jgi:hypothetical protein
MKKRKEKIKFNLLIHVKDVPSRNQDSSYFNTYNLRMGFLQPEENGADNKKPISFHLNLIFLFSFLYLSFSGNTVIFWLLDMGCTIGSYFGV